MFEKWLLVIIGRPNNRFAVESRIMKHHLLLIVAVFLALTGAKALHKFYVGICIIEYNEEAQTLETTIKLFRDDLERVLSEFHGATIKIDPGNNDAQINDKISNYVLERFTLTGLDNEALAMRFIGFEAEEDLVWLYVESECGGVKTIEVRNSLLFELEEEQSHIVHFKHNGKVESGMINRIQPSTAFSIE